MLEREEREGGSVSLRRTKYFVFQNFIYLGTLCSVEV